MSGVVRWEVPPPHGNKHQHRDSPYREAADTLRAQPGKWAVIKEGVAVGTAASLCSRIRDGLGPWAPRRSFEARTVGAVGATDAKVYARFVGGTA